MGQEGIRVRNGPVQLSVLDYGGEGEVVLLLHGLGSTALDWSAVAPRLSQRHHVLAPDLRSHGLSDDAPWSWEACLEDLAAVAAAVGAENPAVVGHSLGGSLAVMWGRDHPGSPGVVNLDGHGRRLRHQYLGLDDEQVAEVERQLQAWMDDSVRSLAGPLAPEVLERFLALHRALAEAAGLDPGSGLDAFWRGARRTGEGTWLRPDPGGAGAEIMALGLGLDMLALSREVRCPLLVVSASELPSGVPSEFLSRGLKAQRAGLARDLGELSDTQPNVRLATVTATHNLIWERPQDVADAILDFLGEPQATERR